MKKTYLRIRKVQNNKRTEIAEIGFKINQKQNTQHGKYKKKTLIGYFYNTYKIL